MVTVGKHDEVWLVQWLAVEQRQQLATLFRRLRRRNGVGVSTAEWLISLAVVSTVTLADAPSSERRSAQAADVIDGI